MCEDILALYKKEIQMFNEQELSLIFEALDALEKAKATENMMGTILGALFIQEEEARKEFMARKELELAEEEKNGAMLKERIIILKAKLIGMRDEAEVALLDIDDLTQ